MRKHVLIAAVALGLGGLVGHLHVASQDYYPVVRVSGPEGLTYTAVLDATDDRPECGEVSRRFVDSLKADCPECRVLLARCENELQGLELDTKRGEPAGHPLVSMPGVSIAVEGNAGMARMGCELVAADAIKHGVSSAKCVASAAHAARS